MQHSTVIIIGGGPGGYETAIRLAQYDIPCLVIEKARLGGVCLNWGCIPTKALVKSAELVSEITESPSYGLPQIPLELDYSRIWERKNNIVEQLAGGIEHIFKKRKIEMVKDTATSVRKEDGVYIVSTAAGTEYGCNYLVIASGSEAKSLPGISIDEMNILSSTGILKMDELPKSLAVVGGGVIGCEFASIFATFGVQVSIIEFLPRLIALEDEEISKRLAMSFKKTGIKVITGVGVQSIDGTPSGILLNLSDGNSLYAEKVLMSVGRNPVNNLEWQGLKLDTNKGAICIDSMMRTNLEKVYAIGDVTAKLQLAHTASKQGLMAAQHIAMLENKQEYHYNELNYINIPRCTFTNPEIASVGYTHAEAGAIFGEIIVGKFPFAANGKAMSMNATAGFVKTIARADNKELVGMHIMGHGAAELIAQGTILIANKCTAADVEAMVFAHPTLSEAIMESIEDLQNLSIHKI
ncbi:MAG: dihydrolipoyl dehydrogenase [Candidatus Cloacimonetes bacterium HGW-Cloacimonetes-3]|jgi:dihydrolipoamide dehydrogenase|nr:MAG: dihydrolipoyl dehydrogenase [Candidatus Cloacimonetes bacterium HGW-Cloacimonetes-3]